MRAFLPMILAVLLAASAAAQTDLPGRLRTCAAIAAAEQRLGCFDGLARDAAPAPPVAPRVPAFADLPATAGPPPRNAPVALRSRDDLMFRTRLREAATQRPNFAGHYVLVTWGCGSDCIMGAVVNTRNGRVTFLPATVQGLFEDPDRSDPVAFRPDSRLLVLNGTRNEAEGDLGTHYYRIEGDRFVHLLDVPRPAPR